MHDIHVIPPIQELGGCGLYGLSWQGWLWNSCLSVRAMVQVFDGNEWAALMRGSILPKLADTLKTLDTAFLVNPLAQDLAPWHWVMSWASVLPRPQLISLLEKHFFPQWHAVLQHWLAHNPDFDEVTAWYLGWKVRPLIHL